MTRTIFGFLHTLRLQLGSGYRPELHYMRGPGPKSRASFRS